MFLDDEEMPASGVLDERLRTVIDRSSTLVLLASPASARSHYVNIEVEHFLSTHPPERLIIVVIGQTEDRHPPLPPVLRDQRGERLWVDCRDVNRPGRRALVRVAAAILGIDFDDLWGRHRRRTRKVLAGWAAVVLAIAAIVGGALWQEDLAQRRTPQRQLAAFQDWYPDKLGVDESDPAIKVTLSDDLNNDGWNDFILENHSADWCGSAGCHTQVFLTRTPGHYVMALDLLGDTTPRVRDADDDRKQILVTDLTIDGAPLYTAYTPHGSEFRFTHYELCEGYFEYCDPTIITPMRYSKPRVRRNAVAVIRPERSAEPVRDLRHAELMVRGVLPGRKWYLVSGTANQQDEHAGFVPRSAIE